MKKNTNYPLFAVLLVSFCMMFLGCHKNKPEMKQQPKKAKIAIDYRKVPGGRALYSFTQRVAPPVIKHLYLGKITRYGAANNYAAVTLVLCRYNISRSAEKRYGLPRNFLLGMNLRETRGVHLMPNSTNDGDFGDIHMQFAMAKMYGLHTYKNCGDWRCKKHDLELCKQIEIFRKDEATLCRLDDRLNPLLNFDAAGRMLASTIARDKDGLHVFENAAQAYSGRTEEYYETVEMWRARLNDSVYLLKAERWFNRHNKKLTINGRHADWKEYIRVMNRQNDNYGLEAYRNLPGVDIPPAKSVAPKKKKSDSKPKQTPQKKKSTKKPTPKTNPKPKSKPQLRQQLQNKPRTQIAYGVLLITSLQNFLLIREVLRVLQ